MIRYWQKIGISVGLILLFCLQAFVPILFDGFNVDYIEWFTFQFFIIGPGLLLVYRYVSPDQSDTSGFGLPQREDEVENPTIEPAELLGAVVHEIRTPLNRMSLLLDKLSGDREDELRQTFKEIESTVTRVESVFRDRDPNRTWMPVVNFFQCVQENLTESCDLEFVVGFDWIYLDQAKITLAVDNLIRNSLEAYQQDEGDICVEAAQLGPEWCIKVIDRAGGMKPEQAFRASNQTGQKQSESGGMGLGLLLVRRIMLNHGGRMAIESEPEVGTEITLTFPQRSVVDLN